jgi:hypothetical protein
VSHSNSFSPNKTYPKVIKFERKVLQLLNLVRTLHRVPHAKCFGLCRGRVTLETGYCNVHCRSRVVSDTNATTEPVFCTKHRRIHVAFQSVCWCFVALVALATVIRISLLLMPWPVVVPVVQNWSFRTSHFKTISNAVFQNGPIPSPPKAPHLHLLG